MTRDPYHTLVSEVMLQQTQTKRVEEKYLQFLTAFPDFASLAQAPLKKILKVWQGLGYNRRTILLKKISRRVMDEFNGRLPLSDKVLMKLPGIGRATASAIIAFAFNKPAVVIETNIRTVFIHFFFEDKDDVNDREIIPLVEKTLDRSNPRKWYFALMDYGAMLKKRYKNPSRRSSHYKRQTPFKGSNRQIRGMILRMLLAKPSSEHEIIISIMEEREKVKINLNQLQKEGFIKRNGKRFSII